MLYLFLQFQVSLEIRPDTLDGLLVHFGQSRDARHQDYFTLMLKNSTLVLSFSLGGPRGGQSHSLTLTLCCVKMGTWHKIEAGRSGRDGYLTLDGENNMGNAPPGNFTNIIRKAKIFYTFFCKVFIFFLNNLLFLQD